MEKYDYKQALREDIREWLKENPDYLTTGETREEIRENVYDELWVADSVTGNASGSYYCNAWRAEEAICHNWDLLADACEEFGCNDMNPIEKGAEFCDVTIRCYLLGEILDEVLDEMLNN